MDLNAFQLFEKAFKKCLQRLYKFRKPFFIVFGFITILLAAFGASALSRSRKRMIYPEKPGDIVAPTNRPSVNLKTVFWEKTLVRNWVALLVLGLMVFLIRAINIGRSYNIFIDEITYLQISQNVATNLQVQLHNNPFYLHPPAFFFIEAAFLKIFQPDGDVIHTIYATRFINILFSSFSAILLYCIAKRAVGWFAGLIVSVFFGLNTFVIRIESLNLLEASAVFFVLAGHWIIISAMHEKWERWSPYWAPAQLARFLPRAPVIKRKYKAGKIVGMIEIRERVPFWKVLLAGICFGIALLIKESTAFLTVIPLMILFLLNWSIPRRATIGMSMIASLTYTIYPMIVYLNGDWAQYVHQKFRGVLRFLGFVKITGFNRPAGPSFAGTVVQRIQLYSTTYILILLGIIAVIILLTNRSKIARLIGVVTASAYVMLFYLIFLGTLEEQFFIYLVVPCMLACAIVIALLMKSPAYRKLNRNVLIALMFVSFSFVNWDVIQWVNTHFTPDNNYERVLSYLRKNVPGGERVASTSEIGQRVLVGYETGPWGLWHSEADILKFRPEYLIVTPKTVEWNYGKEGKDLVDWVDTHGTLIYLVRGREGDNLLLYRMKYIDGR